MPKVKLMELRNISSVNVVAIRTVATGSDEDNEEWSEIEVTVEYRSGEAVLGMETLPFLRFKQLIKEADLRGIEVKHSSAQYSYSTTPSNDIVELARQIIKDEKFDPAVA